MQASNVKRVLLIRLSALGDVVQTTGIVESFYQSGWEIHYLTDTEIAPLLERDPRIQRVWAISRRNGIQEAHRILPSLQRWTFDLVVDLHGKILSRWIYLRLQAHQKVRISKASLSRRWWLYSRRFPRYEIPMVLRMYASVRHAFPHLPFQPPRLLPVYPSPIESPGVVIVPFTHRVLRDWPALHAYRLAQLLGKEGIPALLVGKGPRVPWPHDGYNWLNRTDLLEYLGLIQRARVVVTVDTSASHIAAAFGVPTLLLWGPTHPLLGMRPIARGPLFSLGLPLDCRPCSLHGEGRCRLGDHRCMRDLLPERIARMVSFLYTTYSEHPKGFAICG